MQEYQPAAEVAAEEPVKQLPMPKRVSVMLSLDHVAQGKLDAKRKKARKVSRASRKRNKTKK